MTYRINGVGTTISPMPSYGEYSIAMHWFTFMFIPLIPLGWVHVLGTNDQYSYIIKKKLTYLEAWYILGTKGMLLTLGYGLFTNGLMFAALFGFIAVIHFIKKALYYCF